MNQAKPISKSSRKYSVPPMPNTMSDTVPTEPVPDDKIHNPNHYTWHPTGVECKDIAQEFTYNIGVALSYLWRCGFKHDDPVEDLEKAQKHIGFEIERHKRRKAGLRRL